MDLNSTPYLRKLAAFARAHGFRITAGGATTGHNEHSLHYLGRAIDVSVKGQRHAAIAAFVARAVECGFHVRDETTRPPGQAVWSGPHLHVEDRDGL